jgi:hypothetical protein
MRKQKSLRIMFELRMRIKSAINRFERRFAIQFFALSPFFFICILLKSKSNLCQILAMFCRKTIDQKMTNSRKNSAIL